MSGSNEGALQQSGLEGSYARQRFPGSSSPNATRRPALFAGAIIEENASDRSKRAARAGLGFALQAAVIGVLLLVPLLFTEGIDLYQFNNTVLIAPPPPAAPRPPALRMQAVALKQTFMHAQLMAPSVIPRRIAESAPDTGAAPAISDVAGGVPGGAGDVLGGSLTGPPPPPAAPAKPKEPIRIFSGMKEPALLYAPPVVYPLIAKQAHVSGTVVIEAIIDEKGDVTQVRVVSGPPLLLESALKAVSGRKYQPTILDGSPVPIRFDVKVEYHLG